MPTPLPANDPGALLKAVLGANANTENPRLREIMDGLIRHLHAFAIEVDLTPAELETGLNFLVAIGQASGPKKHEGILLADILGLATLVQLRSARHALEAGGTEPALVGPFWRANQPLRRAGERICSADTPGARLRVTGRVVSFESVRPAGYPVPTDGPCGELLRAQRRHTMRPAHLHFIVVAPGHKVLATQFFDIDDPHAYDDVVFGAVGSLLRRFEPDGEGGFKLDVELKLEPGETRIPHCPIP